MKKKLTLNELKVESFTTRLDNESLHTANGGKIQSPTKGAGGAGCLTVITFGIWSYCCDSGTGCSALVCEA